MANLPFYGTAFNVSVSLFTSAGLITNPGTLTCKISKDYGDYADCHGTGPTEEDSTYGQVKVALDATDMTADHIDGYVIDNTSGCFASVFHIDTIPVVRGLAGTALPNAAADAAGGLPISDAGELDLDTRLGYLQAAITSTILGRIDAAITSRSDGTGVTLHADYNAAKTAAQAGDKMDLIDAPNATALVAVKDAVQAAGTTLATLLSRIVGTIAAGTHNAQSGDAYARIGANGAGLTALEASGAAAAAVSGLSTFDPATDTVDVGKVAGAAVAGVDDFKADVSGLSTLDAAGVRGAVGLAAADLDDQLDALPTANENADALLERNIAGGSSVGRKVKDVFRFLRNKVTVSGGTLTVYQEDDETEAWTAAVTEDATANPITEIDPA